MWRQETVDDAVRDVLDTFTAWDLPDLPPPPRKPEEYECCGRGCERCVWTCYEEAFTAWRARVAEIARGGMSGMSG